MTDLPERLRNHRSHGGCRCGKLLTDAADRIDELQPTETVARIAELERQLSRQKWHAEHWHTKYMKAVR